MELKITISEKITENLRKHKDDLHEWIMADDSFKMLDYEIQLAITSKLLMIAGETTEKRQK